MLLRSVLFSSTQIWKLYIQRHCNMWKKSAPLFQICNWNLQSTFVQSRDKLFIHDTENHIESQLQSMKYLCRIIQLRIPIRLNHESWYQTLMRLFIFTYKLLFLAKKYFVYPHSIDVLFRIQIENDKHICMIMCMHMLMEIWHTYTIATKPWYNLWMSQIWGTGN